MIFDLHYNLCFPLFDNYNLLGPLLLLKAIWGPIGLTFGSLAFIDLNIVFDLFDLWWIYLMLNASYLAFGLHPLAFVETPLVSYVLFWCEK